MDAGSKIYIAGHRGMVGSAISRKLTREGYTNLVTRTRQELNLLEQEKVKRFFSDEKPEYVFLAAAKVGGIMANATYPAEFIYENLTIQTNIIHQAYLNGVKKLLFLGSSCIYPKDAPQPMKEEYLLTGPNWNQQMSLMQWLK
jgi:GDP-L-fucose synthase